jgi:hypothetical protein
MERTGLNRSHDVRFSQYLYGFISILEEMSTSSASAIKIASVAYKESSHCGRPLVLMAQFGLYRLAVAGPINRTKILETGKSDRIENMFKVTTALLSFFVDILKER